MTQKNKMRPGAVDAATGPRRFDRLGTAIELRNNKDVPHTQVDLIDAEHAACEHVLAELRVHRKRCELAIVEIDLIGTALKARAVTPQAARQWFATEFCEPASSEKEAA